MCTYHNRWVSRPYQGLVSPCLSELSGLVWVQWDERCRCRTSADPPPCVAAGHFVAARAGASDGGCPPPARSGCPWEERWRCGCRRSRQRRCCHLDGLRSPLEGKHLWCFWGSLLPSCWLPHRTRTPVWTDNCFPSYVGINSITQHANKSQRKCTRFVCRNMFSHNAEKQRIRADFFIHIIISVYYVYTLLLLGCIAVLISPTYSVLTTICLPLFTWQ